MTLSMKPKSMVVVKHEVAPGSRGSVLVNNLNSSQRSVIANGSELLRCKRKGGYIQGQTYPSTQPASVARRNARERNRVKQVNNGFATLRSHIPPAIAAALCTEKSSSRSSSANKKLSKVETLKMAVEYIRSLQQLLDDHNGGIDKNSEHYDVEARYCSSSPETIVSGDTHYYSNSPEAYPKSDSLDLETEYYQSGRNFGKSDDSKNCQLDPEFYPSTRVFVKSENYQHFNPEVHETLTSEFYHARSPVKTYSSPEREPLEEVLTPMTNVPPRNAFLQPRIHHRNSTSLSPPMSDACPSPTPSYSSDHSSLPSGSVVSSSSGHLTTQLSQLTTVSAAQPPEVQRASPEEYEGYDAMSPEDEELLDVISWWQQSN